MFTLTFSRKSGKFLTKCDTRLQERVLNKIYLLQSDPVPHNAVRVVGEERTFRIRVGDYRVLYEVMWDKKEVLIADIDKRPRIYDQ
ncbi:MAG TPA: type II toxin-antitoxin system RelE/ParE family toxin [Candidatus Nanoarchaeia archaeon]|nr:type II toxin-antitoxin system RelE/ParE family toxin [Candidatus Nanoarchaeia archaeon]